LVLQILRQSNGAIAFVDACPAGGCLAGCPSQPIEGNGYFTINQRKFAYITFQFGWLVLWVILILLGTFLRGPALAILSRGLRV
jgi:hypothetical protein